MDWIEICEQNKELDKRHIHLEIVRMPFSLNQLIEIGKQIKKIWDKFV